MLGPSLIVPSATSDINSPIAEEVKERELEDVGSSFDWATK